jgi:hypothetical protein
MMLLLHFAFKQTSVELGFFRNGSPGSGYFLSFAIRMSEPFDAKKGKENCLWRCGMIAEYCQTVTQG